jgi:hypothetical protein
MSVILPVLTGDHNVPLLIQNHNHRDHRASVFLLPMEIILSVDRQMLSLQW